MNVTDQTNAKMLAALEHLKTELKSIRTGRANPAMVEGILVDVYGSPMRLKDIASINAPESRMLVITPFDPKNVAAIGKGIEKANIGIMPIVDGNMVRIKIPQMDENMRKEMVKMCHKRLEETKISIRNIRRDSNDMIKKLKNSGDIAEDILKKSEKNIQDLTDKYCKEAEIIAEKKEKEVSSI